MRAVCGPAPIVLEPDDYFGPSVSAGMADVGLVAMVLGLVAALVLWRLQLWNAARAAAAMEPDVTLAEGTAIICGRVEYAVGEERAVRVEIEQVGSEQESSGTWSHVWTEVGRRVHVAPFYLRLAGGERVRVQPTRSVFLVDQLDACEVVEPEKRKRIAELTPDERVIARGVLRRDYEPEAGSTGYRDVPAGWVLRPPRHRPMELSSEPLESRFLRRARLHRGAVLFLLALLVADAWVLTSYTARRLHGERGVAVVETKEIEEGDDETYYMVTSRTPWGEPYTESVERRSYDRARVGMEVAIVHAERRHVQYGREPRFGIGWGLLHLLLALCATLGYGAFAHALLPWWEGETTSSGGGRLDAQTGLDDPYQ